MWRQLRSLHNTRFLCKCSLSFFPRGIVGSTASHTKWAYGFSGIWSECRFWSGTQISGYPADSHMMLMLQVGGHILRDMGISNDSLRLDWPGFQCQLWVIYWTKLAFELRSLFPIHLLKTLAFFFLGSGVVRPPWTHCLFFAGVAGHLGLVSLSRLLTLWTFYVTKNILHLIICSRWP